VPGSEAATSLSAPPVALPQQQTQEQRKVLLIKTVRIVCKHQKVTPHFRVQKTNKDLPPKIGYPGSSTLLQGML
jgi:hypothetical protein